MYTPYAYRFILIDNELIKVFGSWGEEWRLNSGVKSLTEDDYCYYAHGYSGSIYQLSKSSAGMLTSFTDGILNQLLTTLGEHGRLMDHDEAIKLLKEMNNGTD